MLVGSHVLHVKVNVASSPVVSPTSYDVQESVTNGGV